MIDLVVSCLCEIVPCILERLLGSLQLRRREKRRAGSEKTQPSTSRLVYLDHDYLPTFKKPMLKLRSKGGSVDDPILVDVSPVFDKKNRREPPFLFRTTTKATRRRRRRRTMMTKMTTKREARLRHPKRKKSRERRRSE